MPRSSTKANVTAAALLREHTPEVVKLVDHLRTAIRETLPDSEERVYPGWHGIGYHDPRVGYVCAIFPKAEHVDLAFEQGALLPDPDGLLARGGKKVRYVEITELNEALEGELRALIEAAILE